MGGVPSASNNKSRPEIGTSAISRLFETGQVKLVSFGGVEGGVLENEGGNSEDFPSMGNFDKIGVFGGDCEVAQVSGEICGRVPEERASESMVEGANRD